MRMTDFNNPNFIINKIALTQQLIQEELEKDNVDRNQITKLMIKQLNQGLYLQNIPKIY